MFICAASNMFYYYNDFSVGLGYFMYIHQKVTLYIHISKVFFFYKNQKKTNQKKKCMCTHCRKKQYLLSYDI